MKKFLTLALVLALCLGLAVPALALDYGQEYAGYTTGNSQQYRDVPDTHWAFQSIATCSQRSWFNGYPDGTFRPEGLITREEAAKVFAVAMGLELETNPTITYTDTKDNWAKAYIEATKPLFPNVANLQGTASFRPTQTITREETIHALVVAWGYGSKTTNADLSVLNMFSDTNSISLGVKPYMAVAVSEGLVSGLPDGTIAAQKGLTRAEFATLLARALSHGYGDTKQEFQAPKITLGKYSTTTDAATMTVTGTVTPADATVTLDDDDVRVSKGSFSVELELKVGVNSFTLTVENAYGTKDSKTITVERTEELTISIDDYKARTEAAEVTLTGMVTPASGVTLTVDRAEVPITSKGAFNVTFPLEVGANVFTFSAKSTNGSTAAETVKVTREIVTPTPTKKPENPSGSGATSEPNTSNSVNQNKMALVLDAEWIMGDITSDGILHAKLLFMDGTTEIVSISKLNGDRVVGSNPSRGQIVGGPYKSYGCSSGDDGQAITQLADTKASAEYPCFYNYCSTADGYELAQVVVDPTGAEDGWMDTEVISDTTIWAKSDFAQNAFYTADSNTIFVLHTVQGEYDEEYYCYRGFSDLPLMFNVAGIAIGTRDNPGIAKYVYLRYIAK